MTSGPHQPVSHWTARQKRPILGCYGGEILGSPDADGVRRIDIPATISALQRARVNTFAYMIFGYGVANTHAYPEPDQARVHRTAAKVTETQWDGLDEFAAAAHEVGIDVWVYLVPPTESADPDRRSTYAPFHWDYLEWAHQIGSLASRHRSITAIAMDDLAGNAAGGSSPYAFTFNQDNLAQMRAAARKSAPWISFVPVLYQWQFGRAPWSTPVAQEFREVVDGYVGVYSASESWDDGSTGANSKDATLALEHFRTQAGTVRCPSGGCTLTFEAPDAVAQGDWSGISQTVSGAGSGRRELSFTASHDWVDQLPVGHHLLQVLVDDQIVWQEDIAGWPGWHTTHIDLTAALTGDSPRRLTLRLYAAEAANPAVTVWVDTLISTGFTMQNPRFDQGLTGWVRSTFGAVQEPSLARGIGYVAMAYGSWIFPEEGPARANYTEAVVKDALDLCDQGILDGVIVYNMNLTGAVNGQGDPHTLERVAAHYQRYAQ